MQNYTNTNTQIFSEAGVYLRITSDVKAIKHNGNGNHMYTSGYGYNSTPTHYFIVVSGPARVAVVEEGGVALH